MPFVIGGDNLPSLGGIGLTDLGGPVGSGITVWNTECPYTGVTNDIVPSIHSGGNAIMLGQYQWDTLQLILDSCPPTRALSN